MSATPETLILLPCHSIWKFYNSTSDESPGTDPNEWELLSFQLVSQDQLTFTKHLTESVKLLDLQKDSALVISGGATKKVTGPVTELQSYYYLGQKLGVISDSNRDRVLLENYARDSMENLLFAIIRFQQVYQKWPSKVIIVGMEFKRNRFIDHHALFLSIPKIEYIGFDPIVTEKNVGDDDFVLSELKHAVRHFAKDPCGIKAPLIGKKLSRDPFHSGAESNYLSQAQLEIAEEDLLTDELLLKYYNPEEISQNRDILKLYKFITNHL